jgi:hypothetical protein
VTDGQEKIIKSGVESHLECYRKATFVAESGSGTLIQDEKDGNMCGICGNEVNASDLGSAAYIAGKEFKQIFCGFWFLFFLSFFFC